MVIGLIFLVKVMWCGFWGKCLNCGEGYLFGCFLKVVYVCDYCGEELFYQCVDDFLVYFVIVVVGYVVVLVILVVEMVYVLLEWL